MEMKKGDQKEFAKAFEHLRYHINGEEPDVKRLHALNAKLLEKELFFYLVPGQIALYRPHPYRIEVGSKALAGIRAVQGRGPALRKRGSRCAIFMPRSRALTICRGQVSQQNLFPPALVMFQPQDNM